MRAAVVVGALGMALAWSGTCRSAVVPASQPAGEGKAAQQAWSLLGELYRGEGEAPGLERKLQAALTSLDGGDAAAAGEAADLLLALFRQAAADETNGRAEWRSLPYWGGGSESSAREFRKRLASRLGKTKGTAAAVPLAERLLEEERLPDCQRAATLLLERGRHQAGDRAVLSLLDRGCHWRPALVMALEQAGQRRLPDAGPLVAKWAADPRASVRAAAFEALRLLGTPEPPPFRPEDAFSPRWEKLLRDVLALFSEQPAADARFGVFEITDRRGKDEPRPTEIPGWLCAERDGVLQGFAWFGYGMTLADDQEAGRRVAFAACDPAGKVAEIRALREAKDDRSGRRVGDVLSASGMLTGQFESGLLSLPEGLLAAWLFRNGDKANAAALLFPVLDQLDDDRWAFEILRDLVGGQCHLAMLEHFSRERDYDATLRLANHLSQGLFDGYRYQERARELAGQLPRRMDDFRTHVLPTDEEWAAKKATLAREERIRFLAQRLRLLNCFQWSQPGGVSYDDPQFREALSTRERHAHEDKRVPVINPYVQLQRLRLAPEDIPALAPFLKDDDYLPTFSYWRDFHPDRTLHRVNWLVAELVNAAAMCTPIDLRGWQSLAAEQRDVRVAEVVAWAREMSGKTTAEVIRLNMERASDGREWLVAARVAARDKDPSLMSGLLAGARKFGVHRADIAELCFHHGSPQALADARRWLKQREAKLRLYAALIVIRHGNPDERQVARKALAEAMKGEWDEGVLAEAVEPILALRDDGATAVACLLLDRREFESDWGGWTFGRVAHHLFLSDHPAALAALVKGLASEARPKSERGSWQGKQVERKHVRGDRVAAAVADMRKDYSYPAHAPDKERAAARAELASWLKEQAARREAGRDTPELETKTSPIRVAEWQIDAP